MISEYEAERWRQLSDELKGQVERLKLLGKNHGGTRLEWHAVEAIEGAARQLFDAFGSAMKERG